jgi:outer membrane receptor protein involved in Fe transport
VAGADYENALVATALDFSAMRRIETTLYRTNTQHYAGRFHNRSPAAYLQDGWRVTDRLTLNAGLRWSGQFFTGASGRVVQEIP